MILEVTLLNEGTYTDGVAGTKALLYLTRNKVKWTPGV